MAPDKPSDVEDQYFMKIESEKLARKRAELDKTRQEELKKHKKDTHWMKCPKCGSDLEEINYQNVMIDMCNDCKGVWLDHGELELLAKGQAQMSTNFIKKLFR